MNSICRDEESFFYDRLQQVLIAADFDGFAEKLCAPYYAARIGAPSADDLVRLDRARKGKKLSNADWVSSTDPPAQIAKMKDGTTHLAYKPEHAVDLDTGAVIAAELHAADRGDTTTLAATLTAAEANLAAVDAAPTTEDPAELVTDKGYFGREGLKSLEDSPWKTRIAEPKGKGISRWRGDTACAPRRLQQPGAVAVGGSEDGLQAARRDRRTLVRSPPRSRRHAPDLAARSR